MSITARQLVTDALLEICAIAAEEPPTAGEANTGLRALNRLLSSWNTEKLLVYTMTRTLGTVTANDGSYTLGTGGDWVVARPVKLEDAAWVDSGTGMELPLSLLTPQQYAAVTFKSLTGPVPWGLYNDYAHPLSTVTLLPIPTVAGQVALYHWTKLSSVATLDTVLDLPEGYELALMLHLALHLCAPFGRTITPDLITLAANAKAVIRLVNMDTPTMSVEPWLTRGGMYDIYTNGRRY